MRGGGGIGGGRRVVEMCACERMVRCCALLFFPCGERVREAGMAGSKSREQRRKVGGGLCGGRWGECDLETKGKRGGVSAVKCLAWDESAEPARRVGGLVSEFAKRRKKGGEGGEWERRGEEEVR